VCTENSILIDYVTETPNFNGDDRAALLFLTLFALPFKSKLLRLHGSVRSFGMRWEITLLPRASPAMPRDA
jgi:hypothetical protein